MAPGREGTGGIVAQLRVEIFYDHEVDLWGYSVPVLSIVGTGCRTVSYTHLTLPTKRIV